MPSLVLLALAATGNLYLIRDAGSYIVGQTRDKLDEAGGALVKKTLMELPWEEVTNDVREDGAGFSECRYFVATVPEGMEAYEAIAKWEDLSPEEQAQVVIRKSPHASSKTGHLNELISSSIKPIRTQQIAIAIGHSKSPHVDPKLDPVVYFWAPGRFTKFTIISDEMAKDRSLILDHATVKLEG